MRSSRRTTTRTGRRGRTAESRQERRSGRRVAPQKKDNTLLIIGGAGGGLLLLIIIIAVAASGGSEDTPGVTDVRPVDVDGLVRVGTAKCEEGLSYIRGGNGTRAELEKGKALLEDGLSMYDEAYQKTNGEYKFDAKRYTETLKYVRGKLLEMK